MAKIVSTPISGANCYVTLSAALEYFDSRLYADNFTNALSGIQESALIQATNELDRMYDWYGCKTYTGQTLDWPRTYVIDPDSSCDVLCDTACYVDGISYLDSTTIPEQIQEATYEHALFLLNQNTDELIINSNKGIKSATVDKLRVEYFGGASSMISKTNNHVKGLLRGLGKLIGSSWNRITRA